MINMFSKYAKIAALAIALMVAAPMAISAAPSADNEPLNFSGQNAISAFNGGGAPVRRKIKRKVKAKAKFKAKVKRKVRRSSGHTGH